MTGLWTIETMFPDVWRSRIKLRMSDVGQKYAFSVPLNRVWNVVVNRRSGSAVG